MKIRVFTSIAKLAFAILLLFSFQSNAQTKWSGVYGNEWLEGKYGTDWARIGVKEKGIYKVTLPERFKNKEGNLHLYHRGIEVPLISATSSEIEFYGIPNDGASDVWLYRPVPTERSNPYYSWFSDESSYFLTLSTSTTDIVDEQSARAISGTAETYHLQRDLKVYAEDYTHDEEKNIQYFPLDQSYYDETKALSSVYVWKRTNNSRDPRFPFPFKLKNLVVDNNRKPIIDVMYQGRTFTNTEVQASIGKSIDQLRSYTGIEDFTGFIPYRKEYTIEESTDLNPKDGNGERTGHLQLESVKITSVTATTGAFSVNFIRLIYPQSFDLFGVNSAIFNLIPTTNTVSRVTVTNVPDGARIYNITNPDKPIKITGTNNSGTLECMVERVENQELVLLVSAEVKIVADNQVESTEFKEYSPLEKDYLIISNATSWAAAEEYETYRKSTAGGSYRTLAVKIRDIYNQFNYGEPSPVAIRRFVDYMVRRAPRDKHNLLLIGPSTTWPAKMRLNRELPDEVPSIGYPGSDILLVEGLSDGYEEVPTIPVGRISATSQDQVRHYLAKVKYYEADINATYRKNVIHVSGGLSNDENSTFAGYLSRFNKYIVSPTSAFGGDIVSKVKQDGDTGYPSSNLNITTNINDGVGFTAYFGHGRPIATDNNIGYASDETNVSKKYTNVNKYPLMYFNGCGVGNIFSGRFTAFADYNATLDPDRKTQVPLSTDWVLAENKGAIAVLANSYYAYAESSKNFIGAFYQNLFKSDANRKTLGVAQQQAMKMIMNGYSGARVMANAYDVSNNHQTLLQGDPALRVLNVGNALPVNLVKWEARITENSSVLLSWKTSWEHNNSHFIVERSTNARDFEQIGIVDAKGDSQFENTYSFSDIRPNLGVNYYRLKQADVQSSGMDGVVTVISRILPVTVAKAGILTLLPNPTKEYLLIDFAGSSDYSWTVSNISGQLLQSNGKGNKVNLANYPVGIYLINVTTTDGKVYNQKVIKE